jgi:hypothetical protein
VTPSRKSHSDIPPGPCKPPQRGRNALKILSDGFFADNREKASDGSQDIVILHVNPVSKVTELMIRAPKNFHVPRHWYSANEALTIISGTFTMKHDGSEEKVALTPGSYCYMPAKMVDEAWTGDEGAMFFITVDGAWDLNWAQ